jgi:hypothetical protein
MKETLDHPRKLQDQLKSHLASTGKLSAGDVATFTKQEATAPEKPKGQALAEDSTVDAAGPSKMDPLILAGSGETADQAVADIATQTQVSDMNPLDTISARRKAVTITAADKAAFISSIIHNSRMELEFPVLGGQAKVRVRSRTIPETRAIIARERHELDTGVMSTRMDYTLRLRSMLMTAQISEFRDQQYATMEAPLMPQANAVGDATEAGWVEWIDHWSEIGDGAHALLWSCIQVFEDKYWRMVEEAQDADFWQPAASTSA